MVGQGDEIMLWTTIVLLVFCFFGGIALCFNGIRVVRREGLSLAHALPIGFGLLAVVLPISLALTIWFEITAPSVSLVSLSTFFLLWNIILYVPWMLAVFLVYSFVYALLPKPKTCDFILVLGCGLKNGETVSKLLAGRLDRALRYYVLGGKKATFVVSGGKGADEKVSEAYAMKQYLLNNGIPEAQIIMENSSTSTRENLTFSKAIMEDAKPDYSCIVVTSNYHVLRAVILARNVGLNAQGVGGKTALYYLPAAFIREYIAIIFAYKALVVAYVFVVLCSEWYKAVVL
jgi:uncharacterized SAM-binding protein YcdF (DUF218 family)